MPLLSDAARAAVHALLMSDKSRDREVIALTKAQVRAAIDSTDSWIETNAASYNLALPLAARNNLTASQKTLLFCYVALRRAGL